MESSEIVGSVVDNVLRLGNRNVDCFHDFGGEVAPVKHLLGQPPQGHAEWRERKRERERERERDRERDRETERGRDQRQGDRRGRD